MDWIRDYEFHIWTNAVPRQQSCSKPIKLNVKSVVFEFLYRIYINICDRLQREGFTERGRWGAELGTRCFLSCCITIKHITVSLIISK